MGLIQLCKVDTSFENLGDVYVHVASIEAERSSVGRVTQQLIDAEIRCFADLLFFNGCQDVRFGGIELEWIGIFEKISMFTICGLGTLVERFGNASIQPQASE